MIKIKKVTIYILIILIIMYIFLIFFNAPKKEIVENEKINNYIKSVSSLVDEQIIDNYKNVISIEDDRYISKLFNLKTGEEVPITSIIKKEYISAFNNKIKELLYLKYPKFIASSLEKLDKTNAYFINNNELIIYFYDYDITPEVSEELYLHVNYNEISKYLDITHKLDNNYSNEDGSIYDLNKKHIAITFDDGPSNYTNALIDILKDNKSYATFFILGKKINSYKDTIIYMNESNMEIGYHSYNHKNFKRQNIETIKEEFDISNKNLYNLINDTFHLIRPPYGEINNIIKEKIEATFILWSIDTQDWRYKDEEYLINYTLDNINDLDIILFHDIHKTSINAIKNLLPKLYTLGYQVVSVSTLAKNNNINLELHKTYRSFK